MKNMSQISHSNLCYFRLTHEIASVRDLKRLYTESTHMNSWITYRDVFRALHDRSGPRSVSDLCIGTWKK